jgi:hypothetical protein
MKIIAFIKWHLRKLTLDMVLWMVFCFCGSLWASTQSQTLLNIIQILFVYGFLKLTWSLVRDSYKTFEKEQQDLFDKIKHSDSK